MNPHAKLGYAMQFGSGTYDLLASMAYTKTSPLWSFGAQPGLVVRNGINSQGYALGNQYYTNIWLGFTPIKSTFLGSKMYLASFGSVRGMDKEMSTWSAGGDPTNTGHERINVSLYLTYAPEKLKGMSFQAEYEHPVVENVTGIQMTLKKTMYFSAKYTL